MIIQDYRCATCKKLLFKGILVDSEIEVKCRGCSNISVFHGVSKEKLLCYSENCSGRISREEVMKPKEGA